MKSLKRVRMTDTNGRKFSIIVDEAVVCDEAWMKSQNVARAAFGCAAIVSVDSEERI